MSYILYEYTPECSERGDPSKQIAISQSRKVLVDYCKEKYGKEILESKMYVKGWDPYYMIWESQLEIVTRGDLKPIKPTEPEKGAFMKSVLANAHGDETVYVFDERAYKAAMTLYQWNLEEYERNQGQK
jgi:hypothetical protein